MSCRARECVFGLTDNNGAAMSQSRTGSVIRFKPSAATGLRALARIAISLCMLGASGFAHADEVRCPDTNVTVISANDQEIGIACQAAMEALGFFAVNGLDTSSAVKVYLVSELPDVAGAASYGCYDHSTRSVHMLHFSDCLEQGPWADLPIDRTLYKSLLIHEVAHALADRNFSVPRPGVLAHEYLAYVTMFATMPAGKRERVLEKVPGTGFESVDQMSVTYYLMDPLRFGAEAYRHFLKLEDRKTFLKDVLSGRVSIGRKPS